VDDAGLQSHTFLSAGLPSETWQDVSETAGLIRRLRRETRTGITVCPMELDPGSPMFLDPERFGVSCRLRTLRDFLADGLDESRPMYSTDRMAEVEIVRAVEHLRHVAAGA
jgi:hypothetical protein